MLDFGNIKESLALKEIVYHVAPLGPEIAGYVYRSRKGIYHIFISETLSWEAKISVLIHEICHIEKDIPSSPYIIGLDMQYSPMEVCINELTKNIIKRRISYG